MDVVPGAAAQLAITAQPPISVTAGSAFLVSVQVEDTFGDPVPTFTGSLAIAMAYNPDGGTLGGILTVTPIQGKATFAGLRITTASVAASLSYTLQISGSGLASTTSNGFDVAPAAATKLVITSQPPTVVDLDSPFGLTVSAEDQYNNVETADSSSVFTVNASSGSLDGTKTVTADSGVATFDDLKLSPIGDGYTIRVSSGSLSTTSVAFKVGPAVAAQLVISTQPPASVAAGTPFGLIVSAWDSSGNVATGFTGSVTVAHDQPLRRHLRRLAHRLGRRGQSDILRTDDRRGRRRLHISDQ